MTVLARWESRGGAHFAELYRGNGYYGYTGKGCHGSLGPVETDAQAVAIMQARVDSGYFLPDSAKLPMKRVGSILSKVLVVAGATRRVGKVTDRTYWEVIVGLPVYSSKLAAKAYNKLPEFADFDGCVYRKAGMTAADCTAYYRFYER